MPSIHLTADQLDRLGRVPDSEIAAEGEVVTELAPLNGDDLCQCLMDGEEYEIVDEDIDDSGEDY